MKQMTARKPLVRNIPLCIIIDNQCWCFLIVLKDMHNKTTFDK